MKRFLLLLILALLLMFSMFTIKTNAQTIVGSTTGFPYSSNLRTICRDGAGNIHVVWLYDSGTVKYANSTNNGTSWTATTLASADSGHTFDTLSISCYDNNVTIAFENIDGNADCYYADDTIDVYQSTDNGGTFTKKTSILITYWHGFYEEFNFKCYIDPTIVGQVESRGNRIYVGYSCDPGFGYDPFCFDLSTDSGNSWSEQYVTYGISGALPDYKESSMVVDGIGDSSDQIYIAATTGSDYIAFSYSTDSGATFNGPNQVMSSSSNNPSITFSSSNIYVTAQNSGQIFFTNSTDSGATWSNLERIDEVSEGYASQTPSVTIDQNGYPIIFWEQNDPNENYDIVYRNFTEAWAWGDITGVTNDNLGNQHVNTPYKMFASDRIDFVYRNGTNPYVITYGNISVAGGISDTSPPTYSTNSTNSTTAGTPVEFRLKWTDDIGLSKAITSLWNGSFWINATSWCSLSGTSDWCNQTLFVNSTAQQIWWKQYSNDTSNNWNASINFSLITTSTDTTPPIVTIQSPSNQTYATTSVWANVTLSEAGGWCGRNLDGTTNVSLSNTTGNWNNLMTGLSDSSHNLRFYCNDTNGNMNTSSANIVYFTINTVVCKSNGNSCLEGSDCCSGYCKLDYSGTGKICCNQTECVHGSTCYANETISGNYYCDNGNWKMTANYGENITGKDVGCYEVPYLIQNSDGSVKAVKVNVCVWK